MGETTPRQKLHERICEITPFHDDGEDVPDAGIVTGWVLVAEWQGSDGNRWLSKLSSTATGDRGLPSWTEHGYCNEIVNNWPDGDSDGD